ncbi:MAG: hypothetical protein ABSE99_15895 [Terracidiphilus sp.]|jgi:hypothetical protein
MTFNAQQYIPLTGAYLCQDCDSVGNNSMQCPACASEVLMGLAGVLDRREVVEESNLLLFPALAA